MSLLTQLIYDRLAEDSQLQGLVSAYSGVPAVFAGPEVPPDAQKPYVWVLQSDADQPNDTKNSEGRRIFRPIWCVGKNSGSWSEVESIALRVRRLFHRKPLNGTGLNGYIAQITGPVRVESDGSVVCLAVTLDFGYSE